ncbi:glycosyltransferase family 4 protein [Cellulomonas sp. NPDC089187]|uniref:glycosyltransferase family 4 protein n=1 Tax=Cellulomonas sp. NPDC089187 TaxID=3154970 RepID=UPI00343AF33A
MSTATLFITRKFPPSVGGMETLAADVWATLEADGEVGTDRLIAYGGTNRWMPLWLPGATARLLWLVLTGRVRHVLVGDVLLYLLLRPVLALTRVSHAVMAMGKDVVWTPKPYQHWVRAVLPKAPQVLAISSATADTVRAAGVAAERVHVVRLGVRVPELRDRAQARSELRERFAVPADALTCLTLGRLVRRKGVPWFVDRVLAELPAVVYLVAGSGPESDAIAAAAERHGVADRVRLLGSVSDDDRELLMAGADVFIQPNVRVAGDMEGFGLVAVEAAMRGSLVVAADLEGLRDAVVDGETGLLVPSAQVESWRAVIADLRSDPDRTEDLARSFAQRTRELYSRERMGAALRAVLGLDR